jgi:DNA invertase Pin-like site-specific DNA recombinase
VIESTSMIGYARVSTADQDPSLQHDALTSAGCHRVFTDIASGSLRERPELTNAIDYLREGDTLVVWRLDRLGRSLRHLIETVTLLQSRGIAIKSVHESIDTTTPSGRLILHVFGSLAEFERELIIERTMAGLAAARARGRKGGRPRILQGERLAAAQRMYSSREVTVASIARTVGVSRATLYRHLEDPVDIAEI